MTTTESTMPEQTTAEVEAELEAEVVDNELDATPGTESVAEEPEAAVDTRPSLTPEQIAPLIEALLFVADGPVEEPALARALGLTRRQIEVPLNLLAEALRERGIRLQRGPDGAQLVTAPAASTYIDQFLGLEAARKLSPAALETLAIIA